jgi:hypothetical protein
MTKINSLYDLHDATLRKESIIVPHCPPWMKPCPAAFVMNLQGTVLLRLFKSGMYIYQK